MENTLHLILGSHPIDLATLRKARHGNLKLELAGDALAAVQECSETVESILSAGEVVYGINTGFGLLANTKIDDKELGELQRNLVLSHATGMGPYLEDSTVRLTMLLKILSLSRGYSGVRLEVIGCLISFLQNDILPCIPSKGSVGASGDLAPLAHMSAALLGVGNVRVNGQEIPAIEALAQFNIQKLTLGPKEGLALLNGTQVSTALALEGLFAAEDCWACAISTGAMSVDAMLGSTVPFDNRIHELRGQHGQIASASALRDLLAGSQIRQSHGECEKVQDPYSLRCQPQVMGAALDMIRYASETLRIEANAVTDNPLVFPKDMTALSGGNFHAEPVAMVADSLAIAIAEIGAIAERRLALLVDPKMSGLPAFLVENSGLNSGFMIAQVTAAALASENKSLAHPASVDSLPTSANQEDHVSMATFAARRLGDMSENTLSILAIELLCAAQGLDFHRPLKSSRPLQEIHTALRKTVPFYEQDRFLAPDMQEALKLLKSGICTNNLLEWLPSGA